eukprot:Hpha_TRINITY_DN14532_c0_g1::TRINITY_DN14532_c0_g1_i1::g.46706::m.46706
MCKVTFSGWVLGGVNKRHPGCAAGSFVKGKKRAWGRGGLEDDQHPPFLDFTSLLVYTLSCPHLFVRAGFTLMLSSSVFAFFFKFIRYIVAVWLLSVLVSLLLLAVATASTLAALSPLFSDLTPWGVAKGSVRGGEGAGVRGRLQ